MINHLSIGVRDVARSKKFYDAALKPLGFKLLSDGATSLGYGADAVVLYVQKAERPGASGHGIRPAFLLRRADPEVGGGVLHGRAQARAA